ncbi:glycoside hydrolase family 65 protein [Gorillibacterium massiliense]|uniref:glycoside hydrolase family 65 protein n=1 Tax=Gorillibacterium massiliense TaxID=1280390 RepID=UPI0004B788A9|nr:glycosyl hydrolase family 65 protein [Gorillibacterium massiliense]
MNSLSRKMSEHPPDEWSIVEEHYQEDDHLQMETIFALGNGYLGMRGSFEEGFQGETGKSVSGTYLNGVFETEPIHYQEGAYGYAQNSETMLNVTDAKRVVFTADGEPFGMHTGKILSHKRTLDLRQGLLTRNVHWESPSGKQFSIRIERMVCLGHKHLAVLHYEVTPLTDDCEIVFLSEINGDVKNQAGAHDPRMGSAFSGQVWQTLDLHAQSEFAWMFQKTKNSGFTVLTAASHHISQPANAIRKEKAEGQQTEITYRIQGRKGVSVALTKFIVYCSTQTDGADDLLRLAVQTAAFAGKQGFTVLKEEQRQLLERFWRRADVEITGDPAMQQGIRYNAFQLLQSAGRDGRTNISAKGLSGEGYEGHYFWDTETFILPFFLYTHPKIARALLDYRYQTLDQARNRARVMAQKGALYPWRTISGNETSAFFPAGTAQAHINADIIYGVKKYVSATGDLEFLLEKGAEMVFETARFWVDMGHFNPERDGQFCIDGVTGPDEYTAIVNNNAYTNLMVKDHLEYACQTALLMLQEHAEAYRRLAQKLDLADDEIGLWQLAADRMFIPVDSERGIVAQDDSFLSKKRWDLENTPKDKFPLLLHYHPLVIYRHQVLKQADVILALYLQGNRFTFEEKQRNYDYYEPINTHDSSLSPCIHSIVAADIGRIDQAYDYFKRTVRMDLDDRNGNVGDGLHTASMGGAWLSIVCGFGGMRDYAGDLQFKPVLPGGWQGYRFRVTFRDRLLEVHVEKQQVTYTLLEGENLIIRHDTSTLQLQPLAARTVEIGSNL